MSKVLRAFERAIIVVLVATLAAVLVLAVLGLVVLLYRDVAAPVRLLGADQLLEIFGFFLLIVVGIELLETLKAFLLERVVHVEVVLTAALVAVARKALLLDFKQMSGFMALGLAAVLIALAIAYRYMKQTSTEIGRGREEER